MRNLTLAAALLAVAALAAAPAQALPLGVDAVRGAAATLDPVDQVRACWRFGWHGWGWYPCYYYYGGAAGPYPGSRQYYGR
jgi:hypothetical protein